MHCPNCGQSQLDDVRYCSRCGLSLWELARWLNDGANAPWNPIQTSSSKNSPRRKGIRQGAKVMFFSGVLLPIALTLAIAVDEPGPLLIPITIFLAGLTWALYFRLFADDRPEPRGQLPAQMYRPNEYLPPGQVSPANVLRGREPNTSEIVQPHSVTEYTTNLLRNREKT